MDVAAFVGFAASGPCDLPVLIEDPRRFADVFGDDLELAWDGRRGEVVTSRLGAAVRDFFRNGGQRCWVVRVTGAQATTNQFAVPGLIDMNNPAGPGITLQARSPGSWSDRAVVGASLEATALRPDPAYAPGTASWLAALAPSTPRLALVVDAASGVSPGDLVRVTVSHWPGATSSWEAWLFVDRIEEDGRASRGSRRIEIVGATPARWLTRLATASGDAPTTTTPSGAPAALPPGAAVRIDRVEMELRVRIEGEERFRLGGLGFHRAHPRWWEALPRDLDLLQRDDPWPFEHHAAFRRELLAPRFPLASRRPCDAGATDTAALPLAMGPWPTYGAPLEHAAPALTRDGLARFDAAVFVAQGLADLLPHQVALEAEHVLRAHDRSQGAPFQGVHAVWAIDEVTLIAAPDAAHRGWEAASAPVDLALGFDVATPSEPRVVARCGCDESRWPTPPRCPPEEAPAGAFGPSDRGPAAPRNFTVEPREDPPEGPVALPVGARAFTLRWTHTDGATYVVRESTSLERGSGEIRLHDPIVLYEGPGAGGDATADVRVLPVFGRSPGLWHYQVRAVVDGVAGRWSSIVSVRVTTPERALLSDADDGADALARVQRVLLRMCAARGDLLAVLSLPERFREAEAIAHAARLRSYDDPADRAGLPPEALSYGMLVHPWPVVLEPTHRGNARRAPPDGAAAGVLASRAIRRGAWISPANEALADVVALSPALSPSRWEALLDARVNVLRQEARGFVALGADTLSDDPDLVSVTARRLLCFLRRVALQKGAEYVFEPHDDFFRREVIGSFERLFSELFRAGAFAGRSPEAAYQVRADTALNPPSAVNQGRFVIELKVAPSIPLSFITVRLTQRGDVTAVAEVR
ncbi:hypothetical protein [Sorangium sp. So ce204]|uniref:hypothetical protein n=1 Tax=Sorangium sp. So ce204 TaxID=3133288 RepID=UPI003F63A7E7